jgi:hypothetical protein
MSNLSTFLNDGNLINFLNNIKVNKTSNRPPALILTPTVQETYLSDFLKDGNLNNFLDNKKSPTSTPPPDMPSPSGSPTPSPSGSPTPSPSTLPGPSTALTDLLLANPKSIEPARGRPLFNRGNGNQINISDIPGQNISQERLNKIVEDIDKMLKKYTINKYAFEEYWYSRLGNPERTDMPLTDQEKTAIKNGDTGAFQSTFRVLFLMRKVKKIEKKTYTIKLGQYALEKDLPVIIFEKIPADYNITASDVFDITTIGIDIGKPFAIPDILLSHTNPDAVNNFINQYNIAVCSHINTLKTNTTSQLPALANAWKTLKTNCMTNWSDLLKTIKNKSLIEWTTEIKDFDINTLTRYTADMCSCFTWWNERNMDFVPFKLQEIEPDESQSETKDYGLYRDNKMLIPRIDVSSYKKVKDLLKFPTDGYSKIVTTSYNEKFPDVTNPYPLLAGAGTQSIELANLASILGSGCHNSAALEEIDKNSRVNPNPNPNPLPTAISNTNYLNQYLNAMPEITRTVGKFIQKNVTNLKAVEFPIYHCDQKIPTGVCYSRIDAITENFQVGEGFAVWEYKTRWGKNVSITDKANTNDVNQALYYCWRLQEMTGIKIKYFYVLYVHVVNVPAKSDGKNSVELEMYVHRYEITENALLQIIL